MKAGCYRGRVLAAVLVLSAAAWTGLQRLGYVDFKKPSDEDLKKRLTPWQYQLSRGSAVRDFLVDRFTRR
jgi:hypothetical protein